MRYILVLAFALLMAAYVMSVERRMARIQEVQHLLEDTMPAITWQSGGQPHTFPAMAPNPRETPDHFRTRYIDALNTDLKLHPVDNP